MGLVPVRKRKTSNFKTKTMSKKTKLIGGQLYEINSSGVHTKVKQIPTAEIIEADNVVDIIPEVKPKTKKESLKAK